MAEYAKDPHNNLSPNIVDRLGVNLHLKKHHPLNIIKKRLERYFQEKWANKNGISSPNLTFPSDFIKTMSFPSVLV